MSEIAPGDQVGMQWWDQAVVDLTGSNDTTVAAAEADEDGMEKR